MDRVKLWRPARLVAFHAFAVAILITVLLPSGYFYLHYSFLAGKLETEARMNAHTISQVVSEHPVMWSYQSERFAAQLSRLSPEIGAKSRILYDQSGREVVSNGADPAGLAAPLLRREAPLYDAGHQVGRVVVALSLYGLLLDTAYLTVITAIIVGVLCLILHRGPLRQLQRAWERTSFLASHDSLTSLPNREAFLERLDREVQKAGRRGDDHDHGGGFALFYLDLDRFKEVNDSFGHAAGDRLLKQVASRMRQCLRGNDFLARLSGDEFAILQRRVECAESAMALARRVQQTLAASFDLGGEQVVIRMSIGIALYGRHGTSPSELCRRADLALYQAKRQQESCWALSSTGRADAEFSPRPLEAELRRALDQGEFRLHYQPQVELETSRIQGVEALLRWAHPDRGVIPPSDFIPFAEETGLIVPIGAWVIGAACRQARKWPHLTMAVNVSALQFQKGDLAAEVRRHLDRTGLPSHRLELEMTESVLLHDTDATLSILRQLKGMGVGVIMDDFGTGYSSLSYLHRFSFDKLKIDRSFIGDLGRSGQASTIVRAIVGLGHGLGMKINAEGIESVQQARHLRHEGCDEGQGFLYGRAVPPAEIEAYLAEDTVIAFDSANKHA